ncbi:MAG: hypothetical protein CMK59_09885 [Proteobacteria bacterium]|nr:hypothetical protein [Pseudomonadota bacterium]
MSRSFQIKLLSKTLFFFLDDNRDGIFSASDLSNIEYKMLFWLAPTHSCCQANLQYSAKNRFNAISSREKELNYDKLFQHFEQRIPQFIPYAKLTASLLSLQLLDLISSQEDLPLIERSINEERWIQYSSSLSLSM